MIISPNAVLDVNHLNAENVFFGVEASDGLFTTLCNVNITIRDVNNHAPQFSRSNYLASIEENFAIGNLFLNLNYSPCVHSHWKLYPFIGTIVEQLNATDLDTGVNADIRYRIQQGSFDDFIIENRTGVVTIARKLDFDRRNTYQIEVVAADLGTPSLSGTATLTISIINSNDKAPYFTPTTQRAEVSRKNELSDLEYPYNSQHETIRYRKMLILGLWFIR